MTPKTCARTGCAHDVPPSVHDRRYCSTACASKAARERRAAKTAATIADLRAQLAAARAGS